MSPNNSNSNNDNKNIIDQARELVYDTVQTDEEREQIEQGKKSAVQRGVEKVQKSATKAASSVAPKNDEESNKDNQEEQDRGKPSGNGAENPLESLAEASKDEVNNVRRAISDATRSKEEKKLMEKAKKTIGEKATDELNEGLRSAPSQVKKKTSEMAEEEYNKKKDLVEEPLQGEQDMDESQGEKENDFIDHAKDKAAALFRGQDDDEPKDDTHEGNRVSEETYRDGMVKLGDAVDQRKKEATRSLGGHDDESTDGTTQGNRLSEETYRDGMVKLGQSVRRTLTGAADDVVKGKTNSTLEEDNEWILG